MAGLLGPLSYMPFPPYGIFFCFVPLWLFALRQTQLKPLLVGGWICQIFVTLGAFNWMIYTIRAFGGFSWPISGLIFAVFSLGANLGIPFSLLLWFLLRKFLLKKQTAASLPSLLLLPLLTALCMCYFPTLFKWHLGYTLFYARWPLFQTAEVWGFSFLNTLVLLSNLLFLVIFKNLKPQLPFTPKKAWQAFLKPLTGGLLLLWTAAFGMLNLWGVYLKHRWPDGTHRVKVLMAQPDFKRLSVEENKNKDYYYSLQYSRLYQETTRYLKTPGAEGVDFVLWPEGGYRFPLSYDYIVRHKDSRIRRQIQALGTSVVLTGPAKYGQRIRNGIFVFNSRGDLVQKPYTKIRLMAFGERWPFWYIPGSQAFFKTFNIHFADNLGFQRGSGLFTVAPLGGVRLGFTICYEGLFDILSKNLAARGADILINTSNDRWFGKSQAPYQHLYITLSRAIEVRRPVVRGTNSGFSAVMSAKGDLLYRSPLWEKTYHVQEVPYRPGAKKTFFTKGGFYMDPVFLWTLLFFILLKGMRLPGTPPESPHPKLKTR